LAAPSIDRPIQAHWLATEEITDVRRLAGFDGLWCVPGSPHHRMDGALLAIHPARERRVPVAHIKQSAISSAKKAGPTRTVHLRIMSPRWRRAT